MSNISGEDVCWRDIACNADIESEKIMCCLYLILQILVRANFIAASSVVKMLV